MGGQQDILIYNAVGPQLPAVLSEDCRLEITRVILVPLPPPPVAPTGLTNFAVSVVYSIATIIYLPSEPIQRR